MLTLHPNEIKNDPERVSNIKPILHLCNCALIKYPTSLDKNTIYLKKKKNNNLETFKIMLYDDVKTVILQFKDD